jgi:hypothetical protein
LSEFEDYVIHYRTKDKEGYIKIKADCWGMANREGKELCKKLGYKFIWAYEPSEITI